MPNKASCLNYLRKLDKIVIPREFTYWVHNTLYGKDDKRMWDTLPTDSFVVNREMSFVDRDSRAMEAIDYGGLYKASLSYSRNKLGKNFQIRVIYPKERLSEDQVRELGMTPEEVALNKHEYNGLGDRRHPKLKGGEKVYIFASHTMDEMSRQPIDILYGVREQDIERYAQMVQKTIIRYPLEQFTLTDRTLNYRMGSGINRNTAQADYYDSVNSPYFLKRDKDLSRYKSRNVLTKDGKVIMAQPSPFEQEYYKAVAKIKQAEGMSLDESGEGGR